MTPEFTEIRALDIVPYEAAIWCTIGGGLRVFANQIVYRRWADDGESIWFMLESHNTVQYAPDELVRVIVLPPERRHAPARRPGDPNTDNDAFLAKRARPKLTCAHCAGTGLEQ